MGDSPPRRVTAGTTRKRTVPKVPDLTGYTGEEIFQAKELARILGISAFTVYQFVKKRRLKPVSTGGGPVAFRLADGVEALISSRGGRPRKNHAGG